MAKQKQAVATRPESVKKIKEKLYPHLALPKAETVSAKSRKISKLDEIDLIDIVVSPFPSQKRRRERFDPLETEKLAVSIKTHGLRQPILVRPAGKKFEIVYGERRFLATRFNKSKTILAFIDLLSDANALELQYEENHQHSPNYPLDDAFLFKYLHEREGYSIEQLADRLNTSRRNVADKLKLNDLIPEAKTELENGSLPLKHAIYIAKFAPSTQKIIISEKYAYRYGDADDGARPFEEFQEEVEEHILRQLSNAPFDPADERLHIKHLQCFNCEERTGFAPLLFTDLAKGDSCLNKSCFEVKTNLHLKFKREELAANLPNPDEKPLAEIVKNVPLVTERSRVEDSPFKKEKPLTSQKFLPEPECEFSEISLIVEGSRKGEETYICRNKLCKVHNAKKPEQGEPTTQQLEALETDFEIKVRMIAREKVFAEAIKTFDDNNPFWIYEDLVEKLIVECLFSKRMYLKSSFSNILEKFPKCPKNFDSTEKTAAFVKTLDFRQRSRLLFLCTFSTLDFMSWRVEPQDGVRRIALDYTDTDYDLLDAEIRLSIAPEEFKDKAAAYLEAVRNGEKPLLPQFWTGE